MPSLAELAQRVAGDGKLEQIVAMLADAQLSQQTAGTQAVATSFDQAAFSEAMKEAFNKPRNWETFDLETKMESTTLRLADMFPVAQQPPIFAVRKLVTKLRQAFKDCGHTPYISIELREFLPNFAPEFQGVEARRDDEREAQKAAKARRHASVASCSVHLHCWQATKVLEFAWWAIAWRKYSISAVVTDQMTFAETVAHEAVVAEVVALGATEGYGAAIGPLYSECERYARSRFDGGGCALPPRLMVLA